MGTGTTIFLIGDGKTVLSLAGTDTTIFLGRLFRGVNSDYFGTGTTIFLGGGLASMPHPGIIGGGTDGGVMD